LLCLDSRNARARVQPVPAINVLENADFDFKFPTAPGSLDSFPIHWWGATVDLQGQTSLWRLTDIDPSRKIQFNTEGGFYDFARSPDGGQASVVLEPTEVDEDGHLLEYLHFDRSPIDILDSPGMYQERGLGVQIRQWDPSQITVSLYAATEVAGTRLRIEFTEVVGVGGIPLQHEGEGASSVIHVMPAPDPEQPWKKYNLVVPEGYFTDQSGDPHPIYRFSLRVGLPDDGSQPNGAKAAVDHVRVADKLQWLSWFDGPGSIPPPAVEIDHLGFMELDDGPFFPRGLWFGPTDTSPCAIKRDLSVIGPVGITVVCETPMTGPGQPNHDGARGGWDQVEAIVLSHDRDNGQGDRVADVLAFHSGRDGICGDNTPTRFNIPGPEGGWPADKVVHAFALDGTQVSPPAGIAVQQAIYCNPPGPASTCGCYGDTLVPLVGWYYWEFLFGIAGADELDENEPMMVRFEVMLPE